MNCLSDTLDFPELWRLLNKLNLDISYDHAHALFMSADTKKVDGCPGEDGELDSEEFLKFFIRLTANLEVNKIMRLFSTNNNETLNASDLQAFLCNEQQFKNITEKEAASLIVKIIAKQGAYRLETSDLLGPIGFRMLLHERWGNIMKPNHERIFQDMNQPLCNYFVNSSHNTYLLGNQTSGNATVEGYIGALKQGSRLLELDILDGDEGEPCIGHRCTLVAPIQLRDALHAIKGYAFRYSDYPLILTIENHANDEQQQVMARIFNEVNPIFGKDIYKPSPKNQHLEHLPSPEALKHRYILRGKANLIEIDNDSGSVDTLSDMIQNRSVNPEFSKLIALPLAKYSRDLIDDPPKYGANCSISISETRIQKLADNSQSICKYTAGHFVKSYPRGIRQDSSNMNPIAAWLMGIQAVAMNMQTNDECTDLNAAMFRINGNSGYLLKPPILRRGIDPESTETTVRWILHLAIISAEYLPKKKHTMDITDPYVTAEIHGLSADQIKHRTKYIINNGFNPVWNETFMFELHCPELAILRLCVKDHDNASANDFIGEYSLPVTSIRSGYSFVKLYVGNDRKLDQSARLLIRVSIENLDRF